MKDFYEYSNTSLLYGSEEIRLVRREDGSIAFGVVGDKGWVYTYSILEELKPSTKEKDYRAWRTADGDIHALEVSANYADRACIIFMGLLHG